MTNKMLAKLLFSGYGQVRYTDVEGQKISTCWTYAPKDENEECIGVSIRKWDSTKWIFATKEEYVNFFH